MKIGLDDMLFQPAERCESEEELQQSIVEFFSLLESLLYESMTRMNKEAQGAGPHTCSRSN